MWRTHRSNAKFGIQVISAADGTKKTIQLPAGTRVSCPRCGTVFAYDTVTGILETLHAFTYADGAEPWAGLVKDGAGNLYGVTQEGGKHGRGTLFRVTP